MDRKQTASKAEEIQSKSSASCFEKIPERKFIKRFKKKIFKKELPFEERRCCENNARKFQEAKRKDRNCRYEKNESNYRKD